MPFPLPGAAPPPTQLMPTPALTRLLLPEMPSMAMLPKRALKLAAVQPLSVMPSQSLSLASQTSLASGI